jgi:hypothetical protein
VLRVCQVELPSLGSRFGDGKGKSEGERVSVCTIFHSHLRSIVVPFVFCRHTREHSTANERAIEFF